MQSTSNSMMLEVLFNKEVATLFEILKRIKDDVNMVFEQDPAARTTLEVVTSYAGVHAVWSHLVAHALYKKKKYVLARLISQITRFYWNRNTSRCSNW